MQGGLNPSKRPSHSGRETGMWGSLAATGRSDEAVIAPKTGLTGKV